MSRFHSSINKEKHNETKENDRKPWRYDIPFQEMCLKRVYINLKTGIDAFDSGFFNSLHTATAYFD